MKNQTRGDARTRIPSKARASDNQYVTRVLYLLRSLPLKNNSGSIQFSSKPVLSTPVHKESRFALLSFVIPLGVLSFVLLQIAMFGSVSASIYSEGSKTSEPLVEGTLVSLVTEEPVHVEAADVNTNSYLAGVVEAEDSGLIVSDGEGSDVYVATSGDTVAFVSDMNGPIMAGDFIGASWVKGVGMKLLEATDEDQKVLGVALEDLSTEDRYSRLYSGVETPDGSRDIRIGKVPVKLFPRDVGPYFAANQTSGLEDFAGKLAGKNVPYVRIVAALMLFVVSLVISGIFMTNAIRGSLRSIGRNPLASQSIFSTLTQISTVSVGLVIVGAAVAYVVLVI